MIPQTSKKTMSAVNNNGTSGIGIEQIGSDAPTFEREWWQAAREEMDERQG